MEEISQKSFIKSLLLKPQYFGYNPREPILRAGDRQIRGGVNDLQIKAITETEFTSLSEEK